MFLFVTKPVTKAGNLNDLCQAKLDLWSLWFTQYSKKNRQGVWWWRVLQSSNSYGHVCSLSLQVNLFLTFLKPSGSHWCHMDVQKNLNTGVWPGTSPLLPRSWTFGGSHDLAVVQKSILEPGLKDLRNSWETSNVLSWIIKTLRFNISGEIIHLNFWLCNYKLWYGVKLLQPAKTFLWRQWLH